MADLVEARTTAATINSFDEAMMMVRSHLKASDAERDCAVIFLDRAEELLKKMQRQPDTLPQWYVRWYNWFALNMTTIR